MSLNVICIIQSKCVGGVESQHSKHLILTQETKVVVLCENENKC